jgi:hypothetical protein
MSTIFIRYRCDDQRNEAELDGACGKLGGKDNLVQSFDVEHLRQRRESRANVEFLETGLQGAE